MALANYIYLDEQADEQKRENRIIGDANRRFVVNERKVAGRCEPHEQIVLENGDEEQIEEHPADFRVEYRPRANDRLQRPLVAAFFADGHLPIYNLRVQTSTWRAQTCPFRP